MNYQDNFSETLVNKENYENSREIKADKVLSILSDYYDGNLSQLKVLEIGCFTGVISNKMAPFFREFNAIDIDVESLEKAKLNNRNEVIFHEMSADSLFFEDGCFDIVICSHVYEHVPSASKMMSEIYRVLKKEGICYFAAGNKISLLDPEYNLLFASMLPKSIANRYVKLFRNIPEYYETFYFLPRLKHLVRDFRLIDYTKKIIENPQKFHINGILAKNKNIKKLASLLLSMKLIYFIFPTYIWILKKEK